MRLRESCQSGVHQCPRDFHRDTDPRQTRDCFQEKFDDIIFEEKLQMLVSAPAQVLGKPLWGRTSDTAEAPSGRPSMECLVGNRGPPVGGPWFLPVDVCSACGGMSPLYLVLNLHL